MLAHANAWIEQRGTERGPWLSVAFAAGICAWVVLPGPWQWLALMAGMGGILLLVLPRDRDGRFAHLRLAVLSLGLMVMAGCATIWIKSAFLGTPPIPRPMLVVLDGTVVDRQVQAAQGRLRLILQTRVTLLSGETRDGQVRINVPLAPAGQNDSALADGARVRLRARLMPPAPPMVPGSFDFARSAWFSGLMATGSSVGAITLLAPAPPGTRLDAVRQRLADHIRTQLGGSPGAIAAAFASGDRGSIATADEDAMRDAGLTHLLSISGLHVSAVVGAVYLITARLLALVPFLALRLRVPLAAAAMGALAGIGYTLLTGAEVPTIRSCLGALLVLLALALGRDPLSLRMLAVAAFIVMLFWPEAVVGPSFQMSFGSVIAIIAFDSSAPVRRFLGHAHEGWAMRLVRHLALVLATGLVIELALIPMALFHFHRAGIYGAAANVVAIPLTTFVSMPLIALALLLDLAGWGAPAWWAVGKSLDALLGLAHLTASQPGAVTLLPGMPGWVFGLMVGGLLWLALWTGRVRLWGLVPVGVGAVLTILQPTPDVLVTGDGHHVALAGEGPNLLMLRATRSDYTPSMLLENAGLEGEARPLDTWPGAQCNEDFCRAVLTRQGRRYTVLMSRGRDQVDWQTLTTACAAADIVIADRTLPTSCHPRWLKADRRLLRQTGGLAIYLAQGKLATVAETEGQHGWFPAPEAWRQRPGAEPRSGVLSNRPEKAMTQVTLDRGRSGGKP
ncbi:ComEC/Rec2 family competence protein [Novosphingobium capsulatum]|nr:ComEC/Rec2 family competence protein [Novosphingobium capsulatum]